MGALKVDSLKNKREFDCIFRNGSRFDTPYFSLYILLPKQLTPKISQKAFRIYQDIQSRKADVYLGLSVSKKIGCAPKRNLYKRRMRALCQDESFKGLCLVFVPKIGIKDLSYADFVTMCQKALKYTYKKSQNIASRVYA